MINLSNFHYLHRNETPIYNPKEELLFPYWIYNSVLSAMSATITKQSIPTTHEVSHNIAPKPCVNSIAGHYSLKSSEQFNGIWSRNRVSRYVCNTARYLLYMQENWCHMAVDNCIRYVLGVQFFFVMISQKGQYYCHEPAFVKQGRN